MSDHLCEPMCTCLVRKAVVGFKTLGSGVWSSSMTLKESEVWASSYPMSHMCYCCCVFLAWFLQLFSFAVILAFSPASMEFWSAFFLHRWHMQHVVKFVPFLRVTFLRRPFILGYTPYSNSKSSSSCGWVWLLFPGFLVVLMELVLEKCALIIWSSRRVGEERTTLLLQRHIHDCFAFGVFRLTTMVGFGLVAWTWWGDPVT